MGGKVAHIRVTYRRLLGRANQSHRPMGSEASYTIHLGHLYPGCGEARPQGGADPPMNDAVP